ncbi:sugar phosphate isomerase/epimerase family protein [Oricola cellulosilytica]|uniref:Sugar phosphate isomerase/epimerase n=1 Tax=Oricola cellulosilytica TaxID=1429082 RepID=A0A4R0PGW1_9HYPH|nr:sugar phosphate isomerase/epimerase [Oricola cellulosilytica]TCD14854.1 sugar phosphate isomerase/epimerase [Oricola cellulosilytica]
MTDFSYQLYSSRNFPPLADTLKMVARNGYKQVEGYGALFNDEAAVNELEANLAATGLTMPTGHFGLDLIEGDPSRGLAIAKALGITNVFVPFLMADQRPADSEGWKAFGKRLHAAGAPIRDAGLNFGWHNHDFEFRPTGQGDLPQDLILAAAPDLVVELDIAWVQKGGGDPLTAVAKYGDRIVAAHLKDIAPEGECADEDGWADVGHGVMDWPAIMAALRKTKARYFIMEHDNPSDHERFARRSIETARKL